MSSKKEEPGATMSGRRGFLKQASMAVVGAQAGCGTAERSRQRDRRATTGCEGRPFNQ